MDNEFTLDPGEHIIRTVRRSVISLVPTVALSLALIVVGLGLDYLDARFPGAIPFPALLSLILVVLMSGLGLIIFLIGLYTFRHNALIFTNLHLIEIEQSGLFSRNVSQVSFSRVQDISADRSGFFPTLFDYGDVQIQSAGEQEKFIFAYTPDPQKVADDALQWRETCTNMQAASGLGTPTAAPEG